MKSLKGVRMCKQGSPTNCCNGSSRRVSGQASSRTVWPERGNNHDLDIFSLFTPKKEGNYFKMAPVLFKWMSVLLDYSGLLWVDDSGGGHNDSPTFTWCRLMKVSKLKQG